MEVAVVIPWVTPMIIPQFTVILEHNQQKTDTLVAVEDQVQEEVYQEEVVHSWLVEAVVPIGKIMVVHQEEQVTVEEMEEIMVVMVQHLEVVVDQMAQELEVSVGL